MFLFRMKSDIVLERWIFYLNDTTNTAGTEAFCVLNVTWKHTTEINAWLKYCWSEFQLFDYNNWNNETKREPSFTNKAPSCISTKVNNEHYFLPVPWIFIILSRTMLFSICGKACVVARLHPSHVISNCVIFFCSYISIHSEEGKNLIVHIYNVKLIKYFIFFGHKLFVNIHWILL